MNCVRCKENFDESNEKFVVILSKKRKGKVLICNNCFNQIGFNKPTYSTSTQNQPPLQ